MSVFKIDNGLRIYLGKNFDSWMESPDGAKVLALKKKGSMVIFDSSSGVQIVTISGEYEHCTWLGNDRISAHDYIVTTVFDSVTGKKLFNVEAMYDFK